MTVFPLRILDPQPNFRRNIVQTARTTQQNQLLRSTDEHLTVLGIGYAVWCGGHQSLEIPKFRLHVTSCVPIHSPTMYFNYFVRNLQSAQHTSNSIPFFRSFALCGVGSSTQFSFILNNIVAKSSLYVQVVGRFCVCLACKTFVDKAQQACRLSPHSIHGSAFQFLGRVCVCSSKYRFSLSAPAKQFRLVFVVVVVVAVIMRLLSPVTRIAT